MLHNAAEESEETSLVRVTNVISNREYDCFVIGTIGQLSLILGGGRFHSRSGYWLFQLT
jgi:hypothetical protein